MPSDAADENRVFTVAVQPVQLTLACSCPHGDSAYEIRVRGRVVALTSRDVLIRWHDPRLNRLGNLADPNSQERLDWFERATGLRSINQPGDRTAVRIVLSSDPKPSQEPTA